MPSFLSRRMFVTGGAGFIGANFVRHLMTSNSQDESVASKSQAIVSSGQGDVLQRGVHEIVQQRKQTLSIQTCQRRCRAASFMNVRGEEGVVSSQSGWGTIAQT